MWHFDLQEAWEQNDDGPKTTIHLEYKPLHSKESWHSIPQHIAPTQVILFTF